MMKSVLTFLATSLVLAVLLSACATPTLQPGEDKTAPMKITIEEINSFEDEIEKARQEQLDILSPNWFAKAEASFGEAKTKAEKGTDLMDIREDMSDARTYLANAEDTAKVARTMLPEVIESRRLARVAGATELEKEYGQVEGEFLKLTEAIEKNNIKYTKKNAPKVNEAFLDLELMAIKNKTIGEVREVVQQVEKNDAKKYAPQAFELAQRHLNETDEFITANRYATDEMQKKADEAMFFANRAGVMTDQDKKLEKMKPEETYLWTEDIVKKITTQLQARDSRDLDMDAQVTNILDSIGTLQDNNKQITGQLAATQNELAETKTSYDAQIQELNQTLASLQSKTIEVQKTRNRILAEQKETAQKLEDERQFNQKFIKIQNYFRSDEAEVYKQGNQLILRLKGIQFPSGQAVIVRENYQLLGKVQRAIGEFEDASVVIEGHTDSVGSQESNVVLSKKRADAVKDYLIANKTIPANKVVTRGYGSEKPLASNATPEGRAVNRRIDVIVTPGLKPDQS